MDDARAAAFQFAGQDIPRMLAQWAGHQPDKIFLIWAPHNGPGRRWTYAQFWADVRGVAAGLAERGVRTGDKILLHADNCPEALLTWYACATLGAVAVTTNTRSVHDEITFFVQKTGCVGAVTQPRYAALVVAAAPGLNWIAVSDDSAGEAPEAPVWGEANNRTHSFASLVGDGETLRMRRPDPMAPVGILFTSGTTSKPKAVVHTHANVLWAGRVGPTNIQMTGDDTYLVYFPFFHVNAQSWSIWTALGVGGTVVLQPKFSSSRFWDVVAAHHVTHISAIPFVTNAIADQPIPANSLKVAVGGFASPELGAVLGCTVLPAFGMTETVTHAISAGPGLPPATGSMGRPTPGYEVLIVDQATGEPCTIGQPGELWLRGTRGVQLFYEYYDNPDAMTNSFTTDGWFRTGDIVSLTESGDLAYRERDSDLLKIGGESVSAREVETVCRQVPGVADVAVVGHPHPMLGEVAVAFVIRTPGSHGDDARLEEELIERCRATLAGFKVPVAVHFVDKFPLATLNKVAKSKLREMSAGSRVDAAVWPGSPRG